MNGFSLIFGLGKSHGLLFEDIFLLKLCFMVIKNAFAVGIQWVQQRSRLMEF